MRHPNFRLYYSFGLLVSAIILQCCTAEVSIPTATPGATMNSPALNDEQGVVQASTAALEPTSAPTAASSPTRTASPTATPSPSPTATVSPTPLPTVTPVACVDGAPELEKPFPGSADLQMQNSRTFFDGDFVYLATQNYVGIVDPTIPDQPRFYSFWQLPQPEQITDVLAHNGVLYVSAGSSVQLLNLNPACRLSPIAQIELPFHPSQMEVEGDRLYVGGMNDQLNTEQLAIFAIQPPGQLEQLSLLDIGAEPVRWSVMQNEVFLLSGVELSAIDVSDPTMPVYRPIDVSINTEFLIRQSREMVDNAFYYFTFSEGQNVVRQLDQVPSYLQVTPKGYALDSVTRAMTRLMQVDQDYIFLGINSCDQECSSVVNIINRESLEPLVVKGLQPHYPVHAYVEITKDVIYAFSDDQLVVIDISDLENPEIVQTVPLTI